MNKILVILGLALVAALAVFLRPSGAAVGPLATQGEPRVSASDPAVHPSASTQAVTRVTAGPSKRAASSVPASSVRYERVHELADALPEHCIMSRRMMTNLSALMAIGDVVHSNRSLPDEEIQRLAAEKSGLPAEVIADFVARYPKGIPDSLPRHYFRVLRRPEMVQVSRAFQKVGVMLDLESDMLVDGFRLCSLQTSHGAFMSGLESDMRSAPEGFEPLPELMAEADKVAEERGLGLQLIEGAFKERFIARHGLEPAMVEALMAELRSVRVEGADDKALTVPRLTRL